MSRPRIFPDSCVLIEGLVAPWSASRAVLIFGLSALFTFVLAEVVIEETERALAALGAAYGGWQRLQQDLRLLLRRLRVERAPHASQQEVAAARAWIRHMNDVPVRAAAVKAKPHWFLTDNTDHSIRGREHAPDCTSRRRRRSWSRRALAGLIRLAKTGYTETARLAARPGVYETTPLVGVSDLAYPVYYSGKPTFLRRAFSRGSPRSRANSG